MSLSKEPPAGHIGFFSFRTPTLFWPWIWITSFISKLLVYMKKGLLIFRDVTFKMAAWQPYSIFRFPDSKLWFCFGHQIQTSIAHYLCVWVDRSLAILTDVQLQSRHCPLLLHLLGGGILVDHWSTIYSYYYYRVSIAPPLPCVNSYTRKWTGRWKHENNNKNSDKRLRFRMAEHWSCAYMCLVPTPVNILDQSLQ